jgi:hypothetical protein
MMVESENSSFKGDLKFIALHKEKDIRLFDA